MTTEDLVKIFKALSNDDRLEMVKLLKDKELCGQAIQANFYMEQSTISHHLNLMQRVGILKSRRDGRNIYYSLDAGAVKTKIESFVKDYDQDI